MSTVGKSSSFLWPNCLERLNEIGHITSGPGTCCVHMVNILLCWVYKRNCVVSKSIFPLKKIPKNRTEFTEML